VLIPRHNEKDLVEIPAEVKADLSFQLVDTLDDVVPRLFERLPRPAEPRRRTAKKAPPRIQTDRRSRIEA
jgi:ATP-dependent Lon protease